MTNKEEYERMIRIRNHWRTVTKHLLFVSFSVLLFIPGTLSAQWGPDVRLTNDPAPSRTSYNNARCVAANGTTIHVVWYDERDGDKEIFYKRSTDEGTTWGADTQLTSTTRVSWNPCIIAVDDTVHIAWEDFRFINYEIFHKRSSNDGTNWDPDQRISNSILNSLYPCIAASGETLHIVWHDNSGPTGTWDIYSMRSTDGGNSWGPQTAIVSENANAMHPSLAVSGNTLHLIWWDDRDGVNGEIYYKRSTDGGNSWGPDTRLTNDPGISWHPCVAVSGPNIHVVWWDDRNTNFEIYHKRSTEGGSSWDADFRLTNNGGYSADPSVTVSGAAVYVVWWDDRAGNKEIYFNCSYDGGTSWGTDERLTVFSENSWYPSIAISDNYLHVVWYDNRDLNQEIYYKRSSILGISSVSFLAIPEPALIRLQWQLALENGISLYRICRSTAPHEAFEEIARLVGSGSSSSPKTYSYRDRDVQPGKNYYYKLGVVRANGETEWHGPVSAFIPVVKPSMSLSPNPFREKTRISFILPTPMQVRITIYDARGRRVTTLVNELSAAGRHTPVWNGTDGQGRTLRTGTYFVGMETPSFRMFEKVTLVR